MKGIFVFLCCCVFALHVNAQDTATKVIKKHIPKIATQRSALIPGWGQIYNKQYWKVPLVYAALAIPASTFQYNNDMYLKTKFAYEARLKEAKGDASDVLKIDPQLTTLSAGSLQSYRNIFRKDRDYSIMWFILAWGLNVAEATVSGHLKEFDVTDNISARIEPVLQPQFQQAGVSLRLNLHNSRK
jgi:hypothetical protein